ncbi:hypothetical protein HBI73_146820 [Parastagonospora nodorum]|nr:hypothetical protein HBI79_144200 [Parastagonospora nodorum]KAH5087339.1 hypothetical protein HBI73_146820 [Parastagonospora nodorum]KAH5412920.1 hypothetical protein HBI47_154960 [Parastagonospora nodorum]KAH5420938.1 hypothetical protein HBI46_081150 [Parastagonospora nodorum]KAH5654213.1 hypothetical protein HBI23_156480 [Parastagonospora nodorum]
MNDYASPMSYMEGNRSSSPKRKKIRQKYAPKACVSCRRSKLKCTGENPCQRCVDNGKRCFYSEDQTAAEVLQNLSRPAPAPASLPTTNNRNANGMSNQTLMPPNNRPDRRASDTSNAVPTMEERMTRVEKMLEALMQERGLGFTPCGSIEREPSVGFRSDTAFSMPLLDPALDQMAQQAPGQTQDASLPDAPAMPLDASVYVRAGNQSVPFPDPTRYQQYVAQFFGDVHLHYPCVDENNFNTRVQQLVTHGATEPTDIHFLALAYVIFACCDVMLAKSLVTANGVDKALGWQWYELADSIVDKTLLFSGSDDTTLIRYLLFQALYLAYADIPALAYAAIRTTCTVALQQNLHQQSAWGAELDVEQMQWRLYLFWNIRLSDHAISLSCGRPPSLHMDDINVETPEAFWNRTQLNILLPDSGRRHYAIFYLEYEVLSAQLATKIFHKNGDGGEVTPVSSEILQYCKTDISPTFASSARGQHMSYSIPQACSRLKRLSNTLYLSRRIMTASNLDISSTKHLVQLASNALKDAQDIWADVVASTSYRHQITSAVASVLLVFGPLLLRDDIAADDRERLEFSYSDFIENFRTAADILSALAQELPYAKRVHGDFLHIMPLFESMANKWFSLSPTSNASADWMTSATDMLKIDPLTSFPYREVSPPLKGREVWETIGGKHGVLWLF